MALRLAEEIMIDRPPREVWRHVADLDEELRWRAPYVVSLAADGDPLRPGTRIDGTTRAGGRTDTYRNEVTEVSVPHRLAWRGLEASGPLLGRSGTYELRGVDGGTRFRLALDYRPQGLAGRLQAPLLAPVMRRIGRRFLRQLKDLAEVPGPPGRPARETDDSAERVVVVGGGPAGLAAAHELRRRGIDPLVVERGPSVATSWRQRHDHLRLNTHRRLSAEPGRPMARRFGSFPRRDDYVRYLEEYGRDMRIRPGTAVTGLEPGGHGWRVHGDGQVIEAQQVVVATGADVEPVRPHWPGEDSFPGRLLHAADFRELGEADGKDVLVIGPGNSGVDLLNHLVRRPVGALWLSARGGMTIIPTRLMGVPLHPVAVSGRRLPIPVQDALMRLVQRLAFGDLTRYGYPRAEAGALTRFHRDNTAPAVDDGFVRALKAGRVTMKPAVVRFDGPRVVFADGSSCAPDIVVCATGYRPGLEGFARDLVPLDHLGIPRAEAHSPAEARPGLWFFGLRRGAYGSLVPLRRDAGQLAARVTGRRRAPGADGVRARLGGLRRRFTDMAPVEVVDETSVPAERVLEAARDFSPRRAARWPDVHLEHLTVHHTAETSAEVTEGNPWFLGVMWERLRYDWSAPGMVRGTVVDSNIFRPGSTWEIRAEQVDGRTVVRVRGVRLLRGRGLLLAPLFPIGYARRYVAGNLRHFLGVLEREDARTGARDTARPPVPREARS